MQVTERAVHDLLSIHPMSRRELARELGVAWQSQELHAVLMALFRNGEIESAGDGYPERWRVTQRVIAATEDGGRGELGSGNGEE